MNFPREMSIELFREANIAPTGRFEGAWNMASMGSSVSPGLREQCAGDL
jgi:hypothetical protein